MRLKQDSLNVLNVRIPGECINSSRVNYLKLDNYIDGMTEKLLPYEPCRNVLERELMFYILMKDWDPKKDSKYNFNSDKFMRLYLEGKYGRNFKEIMNNLNDHVGGCWGCKERVSDIEQLINDDLPGIIGESENE